jgi:peptidoglycan/xylan/chitin deacetylase (PgdA/CDA1 family)
MVGRGCRGRTTGPCQQQLRRVLVRRLSKLPAKALETALGSSDAELRRAAAAACALSLEKGHVPALIAALKDREAAVVRAAHEALRGLTGQDFGPADGADAGVIALSADAWLRWWRSQSGAVSGARRP